MAANERITVADSAHVPLADSSVDVAVFCLSLMGTNYFDFVMEARRVLRHGGLLFVAEVTSRFDTQDEDTEAMAEAASEEGALHPAVAKAIKGVKGTHRAGLLAFVQALHEVGFTTIGSSDDRNTHFIMSQFKLQDASKPPSALLKAFAPPSKGGKGGLKRPRESKAPPAQSAAPKRPTTTPPPLRACTYKRR
jgi:SAM-dependent methyltransferase